MNVTASWWTVHKFLIHPGLVIPWKWPQNRSDYLFDGDGTTKTCYKLLSTFCWHSVKMTSQYVLGWLIQNNGEAMCPWDLLSSSVCFYNSFFVIFLYVCIFVFLHLEYYIIQRGVLGLTETHDYERAAWSGAPSWIGTRQSGFTPIQWNLSITNTSKIKFITCDLFSNVFWWRLKEPIYTC